MDGGSRYFVGSVHLTTFGFYGLEFRSKIGVGMSEGNRACFLTGAGGENVG